MERVSFPNKMKGYLITSDGSEIIIYDYKLEGNTGYAYVSINREKQKIIRLYSTKGKRFYFLFRNKRYYIDSMIKVINNSIKSRWY